MFDKYLWFQFFKKNLILKSIKTKITFFVLILFMASIWSLSFYASMILHQDMQKSIEEQQFIMAEIFAHQIDDGLKTRLDALEKTASIASEAMKKGPDTMQDFLDKNLVLQTLFNRAIFAQDSTGNTIASTPKFLGKVGVNYKDRDYVIAALKEGKTTVGEVVMGRVSQKPNFSMASPIRDNDENIIGSISGVIALENSNFLDKISEVGYGKNGNYFLISPKQRLVITSSKKDRIMVPLPVYGKIPEIDHFVKGYEGSAIYVNQFNIKVLTSVKHIPTSDWMMAISIPVEEVFEPVYRMKKNILYGTFFMTLIIGVLLWRILKYQFFPITETIQDINLIVKEKKIFELLPIKRKDEIGKLIDSFNYLLKTLAEQKKELENAITKNDTIQKQLYQTSKEAEIGKIVANISHQWRATLAKVGAINLLTLAQLKNNFPLRRQFLIQKCEEIGKLLDFMSQTMQDFLEFYKPFKEMEEFMISQTIEQALSMLEKSINDSRLTIEYENIADRKLYGIKNRWIHVWLNLISNTIAAGQKNGVYAPNLKIITYEDKIIVLDNAGGESSSENLKGIGLQMCSEIVKSHGAIFTCNNCDDGFCVTIIFQNN